jgi:hypothetical protein
MSLCLVGPNCLDWEEAFVARLNPFLQDHAKPARTLLQLLMPHPGGPLMSLGLVGPNCLNWEAAFRRKADTFPPRSSQVLVDHTGNELELANRERARSINSDH